MNVIASSLGGIGLPLTRILRNSLSCHQRNACSAGTCCLPAYDLKMSNQHYDVKHPRKYTDRDGNERTYWTRCGTAWDREGGGFALELEYVPVSVDAESGKLKLFAFEQETREERS